MNRLHRLPPEHNFMLSRDEWELAVFDNAVRYKVLMISGGPRSRQTREFTNLREAMQFTQNWRGPYGRGATLYAIAATGRFICLDRKDWSRWLARREQRPKFHGPKSV